MAVIWYENAVPTVAVAEAGLVIAGGGGLIVRVKMAVPVPPALMALRLIVGVPAVAGVPEIRPVDVFTDRPAGKPLAP